MAEVTRGDFLVEHELHAPADRINALLRLLPGEARALGQWSAVRLHHGAAEVPARVALIEADPIEPGATGRVQLVLDHPIAAAVGDRFVLRDHEGRRTIGGGRMTDLRGVRRKRRQANQIARFDAMALADPAQSLAAQLATWPWSVEHESFARDRALGANCMAQVLSLVPHEACAKDGVTYLLSPESWQQATSGARATVSAFHDRYPQLLGPGAQRLQAALAPGIARQPALAVLDRMVQDGLLAQEAGVYRLPDHRLGLDRADEALWQRIEPLLSGAQRYRPPRVAPLAQDIGAREFDCRRVLKSMSAQQRVVEIAPDHFFTRDTLVEIGGMLRELAAASETGEFGAAQLRDRLDNGRKVAIQLLDWFDRQGMTVRRGDVRIVDARRIARFRGEMVAAA